MFWKLGTEHYFLRRGEGGYEITNCTPEKVLRFIIRSILNKISIRNSKRFNSLVRLKKIFRCWPETFLIVFAPTSKNPYEDWFKSKSSNILRKSSVVFGFYIGNLRKCSVQLWKFWKVFSPTSEYFGRLRINFGNKVIGTAGSTNWDYYQYTRPNWNLPFWKHTLCRPQMTPSGPLLH